MTEQERAERLKKAEDGLRNLEARERKAKEYKEEYYRKIRTGEYQIQYTAECLKNEVEKAQRSAEKKTAHPDAVEKTPATILLIAGLVGSLIFKQWYLIWIMLLWWYFSKDRV